MLTQNKKQKMVDALKTYKKKYLDKDVSDLDESGTKLTMTTRF
jgi:hypothetical protein